MDVFFEYVAGDTGAFRLVFESDLTNEPAVRERVDRVTTECAAMIASVIHEDTGLPDAEARLLAVSLVGMAQVSARFWLSEASGIKPSQAGRRRRPGRRPGLARHPRLPPARRALTDEPTHHRRHLKERPMEVKIGVQHAPREVVLETNESRDDIEKQVADAVKNSGTLAIDDTRGRRILVPGDRIAYVEIGGGVAGPGRLPLLIRSLTLTQPWIRALRPVIPADGRGARIDGERRPPSRKDPGHDRPPADDHRRRHHRLARQEFARGDVHIPPWLTIACGIGGVLIGNFLYTLLLQGQHARLRLVAAHLAGRRRCGAGSAAAGYRTKGRVTQV